MKFKKLKRRLGLSTVVTVGTLELLWHATQKNAKRGDIGQFSNEEIAIECDWQGEPDELVEALIESGWLDRCQEHRLVVHDWKDHCPTWVIGNLKSQNADFAIATPLAPPLAPTLSPPLSSEAIAEGFSGMLPNLTQPNPTKPNPKNPHSPLKKTRFVVPTIEEVEAYCLERRNTVEPSQFIDYYISNGWKVGRNTMKDWRAAVRTWEKNGSHQPKKPEPPREEELHGL